MKLVWSAVGLWLAACALVAHAADPASQLDTIAQRAQACIPCHGQEGRAGPDGYYPRIAGKPAEYLLNQLVNFRDGRRYFPMMNYLTGRQRDDYLKELAEYFSSQEVPYAPSKPVGRSAETLARGRQLVSDGDASRSLPGCSACHGQNLLGGLPGVPGLLGVSQDYLDAQLTAWKNGTRQAKAPDCMAEIAKRLSPSDLDAVTSWLSAQNVPAGESPQPLTSHPRAIECGSIP